MTIQNYLTVNWDVSPRIITVVSGITEITIQDLHDTCRSIEARQESMDNDYLINTAGKEPLGGGVYVGLTATLNNAILAFEARDGPQWVLCKITGGNLVSEDENGNEIDPRYPTSYVTVDRASSSSATFLEQEAIQFSSFGGGVSLDITSPYGGTPYPNGNQEHPVNNLADAVVIANAKGFKKIFIREPMIGPNALNAGNLSNFNLVGENELTTMVELGASLICSNLRIENCNVRGTLDGGAELDNCSVGDLIFLYGHIHESGLYGTITLGGGQEAIFKDCYTSDQDLPVTIDMGGSGQDLSMPNYAGIATIRNLNSASEEIGIGLHAGMITLDSTIVSGTIIISGIGMLFDNSPGSANVDSSTLLSNTSIANAVVSTATIQGIDEKTGLIPGLF